MKERIADAEITRIDKDGKGIGFFLDGAGESKPVRVPFCMPKDKVEVAIRKKERGIFSARLLRVIQPADERIEPKCIHFGVCGGCSFQEIPYSMQLAFKQALVEGYFTGMGKTNSILPCESPWNYRNKMEFSFSQDKEGNRYLGLFLSQSRGRVLNVTECHLVSPWFAEKLKEVRAWWSSTALRAYHPPANTGSLRTIAFREGITSGDKMVILTVSGHPEYALHQPEIQSFKSLFDPQTSLYLRIQQAIKGQPTEFFELHLQGPEEIRETLRVSVQETVSEVVFQISPAAFFQPNTRQAERLYQRALELCALTKEDVVYDLYCGTGTLGLLASRFVKSVLGIELSPESSLDARENAKRNGIHNIEILTGSVGDVLKEQEKYASPTVLLIDPPRSGLDARALVEILALQCPKIVYISCNPETQSRDVKLLIESGYTVKEIQPVDQFPQTPHIENIAVLSYTQKK